MYRNRLSESVELIEGDCRKGMASMPAESVDSIVTDPPYGLSFMGKGWDHGVPGVEFWTEALRVLKPGGHLLAFGGTRTVHRLTCAIEDAGFEIRDTVMWIYSQGFPKSLDVSKAIDKAAGAVREVTGRRTDRAATPKQDIRGGRLMNGVNGGIDCSAITAPATDAAKKWAGFGTALKPACEIIIVARKPLIGTVVQNVLQYGTGAINIDGCRVGTNGGTAKGNPPKGASTGIYGNGINGACDILNIGKGRWPANVIHDGSEEVRAGFAVAGESKSSSRPRESSAATMGYGGAKRDFTTAGYDDSGTAARFFYCAKSSKADRGPGNNHPTVKPHDLMRYLCRLVTPPGGTILDPFAGSGSTAKAAVAEGFHAILMEQDPAYAEIIRQRLAPAAVSVPSLSLFG